MIIDWYTVIFQIINFMILVFLLRRFLYGPVIRAMDEREQKIVQREENAAAKKNEAEQEARSYRRKTEALAEQEQEMFEKARAEAEKEKRELLDRAREEVDESRRRWKESFEREKETFIAELRRRIGHQAFVVARRCLQDLTDARLENLAWELFLKKLERLPDPELAEFKTALRAEGYNINMRSAFEAGAGQVEALKKTLRELAPAPEGELNLRTTTDPGLICGLELDAGGYRVAWNIDSYLEDLEEEVLKELEQDVPAGEETQEEEVPGDGKPES